MCIRDRLQRAVAGEREALLQNRLLRPGRLGRLCGRGLRPGILALALLGLGLDQVEPAGRGDVHARLAGDAHDDDRFLGRAQIRARQLGEVDQDRRQARIGLSLIHL